MRAKKGGVRREREESSDELQELRRRWDERSEELYELDSLFFDSWILVHSHLTRKGNEGRLGEIRLGLGLGLGL